MSQRETNQVHESDDVCALPLVRRLGAALDYEPSRWKEGDPLPRGWHLALFSRDTPQSVLRTDGVASFDFGLPDLGLPRLVFGGRRIHFHGDIPIGAHLLRQSRLVSVEEKNGRSGRSAVVTAQHDIFLQGQQSPVVSEQHDLIMREAAPVNGPSLATTQPMRESVPAESLAQVRRSTVTPDELLLFRVAAVMFNAHRIHYDLPYATVQEGYSGLVVNASVSTLLLLEFYRAQCEPMLDFLSLRHMGMALCGRPLTLCATPGEERAWSVWAESEAGGLVVKGQMGSK
ncbi:FAS1-like dehydratase domain-containing protein [Ottowia thiooxydans]|uniref:FAS1-like dehydratase domain-containing protein n=1 Tax=Ottowia thiooxydans TaxID=219182 RepID=UPI0003F888CC|nr:MaoC family dehydratase N-terminal domain-containing protein [Ottowia thiooxydans]